MGFTKLIARVRGMLLSQQTEWPHAAAEPDTVKGLYVGYIAVLAAIPPLFRFIKGSLIGSTFFGVTVRTPIMMGIVGMIVGYALSLVLAYVIALLIDALASSFDGQRNQVQALKSVAYAWTAYWIASVAAIIPWLGVLILVAGGIYTIYLLYLGLPHTMRCPKEKSAGYTAVTVVIAIVLGWILAILIGMITAAGAIGAGIQAGNAASVSFDKDGTLGQMREATGHMQADGHMHAESRKLLDAQPSNPAADNPGNQQPPGFTLTMLPSPHIPACGVGSPATAPALHRGTQPPVFTLYATDSMASVVMCTRIASLTAGT